jgi:hypothetical protein
MNASHSATPTFSLFTGVPEFAAVLPFADGEVLLPVEDLEHAASRLAQIMKKSNRNFLGIVMFLKS